MLHKEYHHTEIMKSTFTTKFECGSQIESLQTELVLFL